MSFLFFVRTCAWIMTWPSTLISYTMECMREGEVLFTFRDLGCVVLFRLRCAAFSVWIWNCSCGLKRMSFCLVYKLHFSRIQIILVNFIFRFMMFSQMNISSILMIIKQSIFIMYKYKNTIYNTITSLTTASAVLLINNKHSYTKQQ